MPTPLRSETLRLELAILRSELAAEADRLPAPRHDTAPPRADGLDPARLGDAAGRPDDPVTTAPRSTPTTRLPPTTMPRLTALTRPFLAALVALLLAGAASAQAVPNGVAAQAQEAGLAPSQATSLARAVAQALPRTEQDRLAAGDPDENDWFGISVAVSGETAVVGAEQDDDAGVNSGSAYVFTRSGTTWSQQAKLTADDAAGGDRFGGSVAVSGGTVVVGAYRDEDAGFASGSAYVFTRSGTTWSQQAKLTANDAAEQDEFGFSVAISGETIVVGAYLDDDVAGNSGSAYVFTRSGTAWSQQAKLTASDAAEDDEFGASVAISGETVVVGAADNTVDDVRNSGSAYVFTRSGTTWTQQARLTASDAAAGDRFGNSVSVSGETAVVGARGDSDAGTRSGSAYVFTRSGTAWTEQAKLTAGDADLLDEFGFSVAVSGETVVVGANRDNDAGSSSGSAYVFTRSGTAWSEQAKLIASDAAENDRLGTSVAISGETAVVGAYLDDDGGDNSGSAYTFLTATPQAGPTFTVNTTDGADDGFCGTEPSDAYQDCSLADAVAAANAATGDNTITFASDVRGTITLDGTQLRLSDDVTIEGPGADLLAVDGDALSRVVQVASVVTASISGLTVQNGRVFARNRGGGIFNQGTLTLTESTISGNTAFSSGFDGGFGGGIANDGMLIVTASTISDNQVRSQSSDGGARGGGISNRGTLTVTASTISGNSAGTAGGAIYSITEVDGSEPVTITRTTISGNTAGLGGGLLHEQGRVVVDRSTITGNTATDGRGSGIASLAETVVTGSIVAGNTNSDLDFVFVTDNTFTSGGFNVVGTGTGVDGATFTEPGDVTGVADPLLGPLADNGGPTLTRLPQTGSPAIDRGGTCGPDQRGEPAPLDGDGDFEALCDAGSVEAPTVTGVAFEAATASALEDETVTIRVRLSAPAGAGGATVEVAVTSGGDDLEDDATQTATFGSGEDTATVSFTVANDGVAEPAEDIVFALEDATGAVIADPSALTLTVGASRTDVQFASATYSGLEGEAITLTVTLAAPAVGGETVDVALTSGDVADLGGYETQRVTFATGDETATVIIPVTDDGRAEDAEDFVFALEDAVGLDLSDPAETTLTVAASRSAVAFAPDTYVGVEGATITVTVEVPVAAAGGESVDVVLEGGSAGATASDLGGVSRATATFATGATTATVTFEVADDGEGEDAETFTLGLQNPVSLNLGDPQTATLLIDPSAVAARFASVQQAVFEDAGSVTLVVELTSEPLEDAEIVVVLESGDPADLGGFERAVLEVGPNRPTRFEVVVPVTDDAVVESDETFVFGLTAQDPDGGTDRGAGGLVVAETSTAVIVVDNDGALVTATVPARDLDADSLEDGGPRAFAVPVGGLTAREIQEATGSDSLYVFQDGLLVALEDDAAVGAGRVVIADVAPGADLTFSGSQAPSALEVATTTVAVGDETRVLAAIGNPTSKALALEDALAVTGGTLADVVLVFDAAAGSFRPVSLAGLEDADLDAVLGAFGAVIVQIVPDANTSTDLQVALALDGPAATGTDLENAAFVPTDGETAVVLALRPTAANGAQATAARPATDPGDTVALRLGIGGTDLDAFDGLDVVSPLGPTLAALEVGATPFAAVSLCDALSRGPVTVPLVLSVLEVGSYEIALTTNGLEVDGRPVVVEVFDGTRGIALEDGPYAFETTASDVAGGMITGRFSVQISLRSTVANQDAVLEAARMVVFPNPTAGAATIVLEAEVAVRVVVYDALGREVSVLHDGPAMGELRLAVSGLVPGVYMVRVEGEGEALTRSLTVTR